MSGVVKIDIVETEETFLRSPLPRPTLYPLPYPHLHYAVSGIAMH